MRQVLAHTHTHTQKTDTHTHRNQTHMFGVILLVSSDSHSDGGGWGGKSVNTFDRKTINVHAV